MADEKRYILLGLSSDTVVGLASGSYEKVASDRNSFDNVAKNNGLQLKIEELPEMDMDGEPLEDLPSVAKLTKLFGYLLNL